MKRWLFYHITFNKSPDSCITNKYRTFYMTDAFYSTLFYCNYTKFLTRLCACNSITNYKHWYPTIFKVYENILYGWSKLMMIKNGHRIYCYNMVYYYYCNVHTTATRNIYKLRFKTRFIGRCTPTHTVYSVNTVDNNLHSKALLLFV